ncbi:CPBP family intramembrane glutamic endopeptidase [Aquisalinus luteolus]|nr:CPBP family intramembrane glutamic endopeptidase [Aquisalinus luteolus]
MGTSFSNPLTALSTGDLFAIGYILIVLFFVGLVLERFENRRIRGQKPGARKQSYALAMAQLWGTTILVLSVWFIAERGPVPWGFNAPVSWQALTVLGLIALTILYFGSQLGQILFSPSARTVWQKAMADMRDRVPLLPKTRSDAALFALLGITAGITEEIIFRFYLIGTLQLAMPLWAAALASLTIFVLLHSYQGTQGMAQVAIIGTVITVLYVLGAPLWLLIVLHILVDLFAALLFFLTAQGKAPPAGEAIGSA